MAEGTRKKGGKRKSTVELRGVIEHNRKAEVRSAGGSLAAPAPPILRWQAANGGPLQWRMLMPNSGPWGLAPFPKHKQRRSAEVHAWQLPFTPTRAGENKGINHRRLVGFLPYSSAALSLRGSTAPDAPIQAAQASVFPLFSSHSHPHSCLSANFFRRIHMHTINAIKVLLYCKNIWSTKRITFYLLHRCCA